MSSFLLRRRLIAEIQALRREDAVFLSLRTAPPFRPKATACTFFLCVGIEYDTNRFVSPCQRHSPGPVTLPRPRGWIPAREKAARRRVAEAVAAGRLIRPSSCENCGRGNTIIEGHHRNYSEPLVVAWLCRWCHRAADRRDHPIGQAQRSARAWPSEVRRRRRLAPEGST